VRGERPSHRRAAEKRDELAPPHGPPKRITARYGRQHSTYAGRNEHRLRALSRGSFHRQARRRANKIAANTTANPFGA
jgi:hypothetical protein